jgi:hypothetical protein
MSTPKLCPSRNLSESSLTSAANNNFECNIILCDESVCLDAKESYVFAQADICFGDQTNLCVLASDEQKKMHGTVMCSELNV